MNILFVGKWDIAGAYIADRLIREGHTASWMTEQDDRVLWNKKFKGNIYAGVWKREDYLRILKANSVDTVIYMTAPFRENYEEFPEYESQILDLTNLLNVLRSHPIKMMLYLSSLELDYEEIHSPVLTDLAAGELLCEAYRKAYDLPILMLRLGCVYGHYGLNRMGYTGYLIKKMQNREPLKSLYSKDNYIDPVYGEDVAVAVNNLLSLEKQGLYRLMTGHPITLEEYYNILGEVTDYHPKVTWYGKKSTASKEYFCSDKQIKLETGWMPYYLIKEKGPEIFRRAMAEKPGQENDDSRENQQWQFRLLKKPVIGAAIETLLLFAFTCFLLYFSKGASDIKYVDIRLMFVALVSCMHGVRFGIVAIILASLSYAFGLSREQIDISYILYSVDTWIPFVVYTVTGVFIGYMVDRRKDEKESLQENYSLLSDKYEFLKSIHGETLEIKSSLQRQIITSKYSFGHAYEVAVELDNLKPELILLKVINILENIMDCKKAAVFMVNSSNPRFARMKACSFALRDEVQNSVDMEQFPQIYQSFHEEKLFVNTELLDGYPDYAAPIYYREKIFAYVAVYDVKADKFTIYFQNLFKIISSLIETNLVKALEYENARKKERYLEGTDILAPEAFQDYLQILQSENGDATYTYIKAKVYSKEELSPNEVAERLGALIRGTDCMGIDDDGNYAVILVNLSKQNLDLIRERFERKGLILEAEENK